MTEKDKKNLKHNIGEVFVVLVMIGAIIWGLISCFPK